jgi:hypothetical protein
VPCCMARRSADATMRTGARQFSPETLIRPVPPWRTGLFLLILVACTNHGLADPFGNLATPEFQVNTHTPNDQRIPTIAADVEGNSLVVWQSRNQDGPGWSIHGQRFNALPEPLGEEFRLNDFNEGSQDAPHVSMQSDGAFRVTWSGTVRATTRPEIIKRRFDADAQPLFADRQVGESADDLQVVARSAVRSDGRFVVAWEGRGVTSNTFNILARHFGPDSEPLTPVTQINQFDSSAQRRATVAVNDSGDQVIAWQSAGQDGSDWGIFARCMSFAAAAGDEFLVNETTQGGQARPRVAMADDGGFAIVWQDNMGQSSFSYQRVMIRFYDQSCQPLTGELQVNQFDEGIQDLPDVAIDGQGIYVVVWQSFMAEFENQGIYGRRVEAQGQFVGQEFKISQEVEAFQDFPAVAGMPDGGFMVAWETAGQDGSGFGIYARRFFGSGPAALVVLEGANQQALIGQPFSQPLRIRLQDQWGQPIAGRILRLLSSEFGPAVRFEGGQAVIEQVTDNNGEISVMISANELAGAHHLNVSLVGEELELDIDLVNVAALDPPLPVPLGGLWWLALVFLCGWFACVNLRLSPRRVK